MNLKPNTEKLLKAIIFLFGLYFIIAFLYASLARLNYPFALEWMEGGQLIHTQRVLEGKSIYTPPTMEFVPYIYTPFYPWITAALASITGLSFFPLRLVSLISVIATLLMLYLLVQKRTKSHFAGFLSAGLYAASYQASGYWLDIGRVDSLFIFFLMASIFLMNEKESSWKIVLSSFTLFLAYFTKQTALIIFIPLAIYCFINSRKSGIIFTSVFTLSVLISTILMSMATDGWYYFWNFSFPASHHWNMKYIYSFWTGDLIKILGYSILLLPAYYLTLKSVDDKKTIYLTLMILIGTIACSWLTRLHYGGFQNSLIPAYFSIALIFGLSFNALQFKLKNIENSKTTMFSTLLLLVVLFQFINLFYNPQKAIPTREDEKIGNELLNKIKSSGDSNWWIPCHPELNYFAGKKSYVHAMLVYDLLISNSDLKWNLVSDIEKRYQGEIDYILLNSDWNPENIPKMDLYFTFDKKFVEDKWNFFTVIGKTRPDLLYIKKRI